MDPTTLSIALLALKLIYAWFTGRKDVAQAHAQSIVDRLGAATDKANKQAAEAEVRAASAEAKSDAKDHTLADFQSGGKL